jgi:enoyl-CoA hydratase
LLAVTQVLVRREGALGRLTLNRPEALNALSPAMIRALAAALDAWERDDEVAAVLLDGAGTRGLCAGGDVRFLYDDRGGHASAVLLAEEYRLDARIARYPKPYVAVMDGLVMGGGVGVSAHGSVRVVTERTRLAMPEVGIGNVPDVGGTYLLAHAPGELGTHAALTGARLTGADAIACGLADLLVPAERLPDLAAALGEAGNPAIVAEYAVDLGPSPLAAGRDWIDACYATGEAVEIVRRLRAHGRTEPADAIEAASPIAVVLTLRALRAARSGTLEQALEREYALLRACVRWPDFREGVRAKLIDRDGAPRWDPPTLAGVTDEVIERFLAALRLDDPVLWPHGTGGGAAASSASKTSLRQP